MRHSKALGFLKKAAELFGTVSGDGSTGIENLYTMTLFYLAQVLWQPRFGGRFAAAKGMQLLCCRGCVGLLLAAVGSYWHGVTRCDC